MVLILITFSICLDAPPVLITDGTATSIQHFNAEHTPIWHSIEDIQHDVKSRMDRLLWLGYDILTQSMEGKS